MGSLGVQGRALARITVMGLLCCLSASCGSDITGDGSIDDLPGGSSPTLSDLFGTTLLRADGSQANLVTLQGQSLIGIYFASRSCPACAGFTPELVSAYAEIREAGKPFEIVLVSTDPPSTDLAEYMTSFGMDWLAVPPWSDKIMELLTRYGVEWIPTLVVIDSERRTVTKSGREDVIVRGASAFEKWLAATPAP